jgi:hypothetical protein
MTRYLFVVAVTFLLMSPSASLLAAESQTDAPVDIQQDLGQDKAKSDACECCQKCKAAKSPIKSEEKEGKEIKDGCEDCCTKCGEVLKPAPEATPPEQIEKKVRLPEQ